MGSIPFAMGGKSIGGSLHLKKRITKYYYRFQNQERGYNK
jgi:hypothetical protein